MTSSRSGRTGQPLWGLIVDELAQEIVEDQLPPGTKLPVEADLMERFGVSRFTLRRAMGVLEERGLIRVEQGRGTFVHDDVIHYRISQHISFSENLREQGKEPKLRELAIKIVKPPAPVRDDLRLGPRERTVRLSTLNFADDIVVSVSDNYYPEALFPDFADRWRRLRSLVKTYEAFGFVNYERVATAFSARLPTPDEARQLRQPPSRPVIVTRKIDAASDGRRICYGQSLWSADRVEMFFGAPFSA